MFVNLRLICLKLSKQLTDNNVWLLTLNTNQIISWLCTFFLIVSETLFTPTIKLEIVWKESKVGSFYLKGYACLASY